MAPAYITRAKRQRRAVTAVIRGTAVIILISATILALWEPVLILMRRNADPAFDAQYDDRAASNIITAGDARPHALQFVARLSLSPQAASLSLKFLFFLLCTVDDTVHAAFCRSSGVRCPTRHKQQPGERANCGCGRTGQSRTGPGRVPS